MSPLAGVFIRPVSRLVRVGRIVHAPSIKTILVLLLLLFRLHGLEVARPFGSHMVLPHGVSVPLHGKAAPGEIVSVHIGGNEHHTRCQQDGVWRIALPAMAATDKPLAMSIRSGEKSLLLDDILIGEVWLCSGQSNMDFPLQRATGGAAELTTEAPPGLRFFPLTGMPTNAQPFRETDRARMRPATFFQGSWQVPSTKERGALSAIAWWFACQRTKDTGRPIGIVENAVGGSGTEAWLSTEILRARSEYADLITPKWLDHPQVSAWARQRARQQIGALRDVSHPFQPGFLYESGIVWWRDFPFAGVLWYQGETNAEINDVAWNARLLEDLMGSWRKGLGQEKLPFFLVELPRIGGNDPLRRFWPQYREAQQQAVTRTPLAYRIEIKDLGWDSPDVHPPDKKPIALRLAGEVKRQLPQ